MHLQSGAGPVTKALFWKRCIVYNAEYWLTRLLGFFVDKLDNSSFDYIFQCVIVPLSFIKEMGNSGTVAGAVLLKVNGFSVISKRKDGY